MNNGTDTVTTSPADVLRRVADWFEEDPTRWGQTWYLDPDTGCRCQMGGIAYILAPESEDADPFFLPIPQRVTALAAVDLLTAYLVDGLGFTHAFIGISAEDAPTWPEPLAGIWNDLPGRTVEDVVAALRAAAERGTR